MISFTVPGQPVPKARARVTKRGHAFTPPKTKAYSDLVGALCKAAAWQTGPLNGPVALSVNFIVKAPIRLPKDRSLPTTKPDIDNLIKAVMDGMNGIAWHDDAQVVSISATKAYGEPGAYVSVAPIKIAVTSKTSKNLT